MLRLGIICREDKTSGRCEKKRKEKNRQHVCHISYTIIFTLYISYTIIFNYISCKMLMNLGSVNLHWELVWFCFMNWQDILGCFCFPRTKHYIYHCIRTKRLSWSAHICVARLIEVACVVIFRSKLHLLPHFAIGTQQLLLLAAQMLLRPVYTGYFLLRF